MAADAVARPKRARPDWRARLEASPGPQQRPSELWVENLYVVQGRRPERARLQPRHELEVSLLRRDLHRFWQWSSSQSLRAIRAQQLSGLELAVVAGVQQR